MEVISVICLIISQYYWQETSQADFRDGTFDGNIYASCLDSGTIEFTSRWDLNNDGYMDLAVANEFSSTVTIYWGSSSGYSAGNMTDYAGGGGDVETADINHDGLSELMVISHPSGGYGVRIYIGTPGGPDTANYYDVLIGNWNETCYLSDLNKDGYIDLIVNMYAGGNGAVFWGGDSVFSDTNVTLLPSSSGEHNIEAADFTKDGWLDIVFIREDGNSNTYVYLNDQGNFDPMNRIILDNPPGLTTGCSVADLNKDSLLDVVLTSFGTGASLSYIYTYNGAGFDLWDSLQAGKCFGGSSIADFNNDEYLDILYLRGYGTSYYPVIYWGRADGFSNPDSSMIGQLIDASGAFVTDFNFDNIPDIFIDNYSDAPLPSYILLGPTWTTPTTLLPTQRDAHSRFREIGNVYNRKKCEYYCSSVYDACSLTNWSTIEWQDSVPPGASITVAVRTGNTPVYDSTWSSWCLVANGGAIPDYLNARFIQYLAVFQYTDPAYLPSLREVTLSYTFEIDCMEGPSPNRRFTVSTIPAREQVVIEYETHAAACRVQIAIYDIAGRRVKFLSQGTQPAGIHTVYWLCDDDNRVKIPSGSYFIVARFDDRISTTKVIVDRP